MPKGDTYVDRRNDKAKGRGRLTQADRNQTGLNAGATKEDAPEPVSPGP